MTLLWNFLIWGTSYGVCCVGIGERLKTYSPARSLPSLDRTRDGGA